MHHTKLYAQVLSNIKPSHKEKEQTRKTVELFLKRLQANVKDATVLLGGSGAKDTWLSGNHDVDVFVLFDYQKFSNKSMELSNLLEAALSKAFPDSKLSRVHGSRDYFQLIYKNLNMEVIPILKLSQAQQAKNITDVSPLHSIWVNKHTKKLKDEIRIAKQFLKANNLYGAESHIMGLSGYVVEILIAHYGSFEKLLKACQSWKLKQVIDVEQYYPRKDALFHLNQSKTQSPLIVIDPVDKSRNAAAAFSLEKFQLLQQKAKEYLQRPNISFFEKKQLSLELLKKEAQQQKANLIYIEIAPLPGKEDVVGAKLLKVFHYLQEKLASFGIVQRGWELQQEAKFYFMLSQKELPLIEVRPGPPLSLKEHVDHFKKEHKDTFVNEGKIHANVKVPYPQLEDFVSHVLKDKYVKERVKRIIKVSTEVHLLVF